MRSLSLAPKTRRKPRQRLRTMPKSPLPRRTRMRRYRSKKKDAS